MLPYYRQLMIVGNSEDVKYLKKRLVETGLDHKFEITTKRELREPTLWEKIKYFFNNSKLPHPYGEIHILGKNYGQENSIDELITYKDVDQLSQLFEEYTFQMRDLN